MIKTLPVFVFIFKGIFFCIILLFITENGIKTTTTCYSFCFLYLEFFLLLHFYYFSTFTFSTLLYTFLLHFFFLRCPTQKVPPTYTYTFRRYYTPFFHWQWEFFYLFFFFYFIFKRILFLYSFCYFFADFLAKHKNIYLDFFCCCCCFAIKFVIAY